MGKVYERIDDRLRQFIREQHLFFVATAPSGSGHVNLSPKGMDTFHVLGDRRVAYVDFTGSGVETIAHLVENGRITIMFCAFKGPPKILRLYGSGRVVAVGDPEMSEHAHLLPEAPPTRSIIFVEVDRIADACGYGVPLYEYEGERSQLVDWAARKGPEGLVRYRAEKNAASIDGLPGLPGVPNAKT